MGQALAVLESGIAYLVTVVRQDYAFKSLTTLEGICANTLDGSGKADGSEIAAVVEDSVVYLIDIREDIGSGESLAAIEGLALYLVDAGRNLDGGEGLTVFECFAADGLQTIGKSDGCQRLTILEGCIVYLGDTSGKGNGDQFLAFVEAILTDDGDVFRQGCLGQAFGSGEESRGQFVDLGLHAVLTLHDGGS